MSFYLGTTIKRLSSLLIIGGVLLFLASFGPIIWGEINYFARTNKPIHSEVPNNNTSGSPLKIKPANLEASITIEKIGISAPIVLNVSVGDEKNYKEALENGVAHAKGSALPGKSGNVYLFAHSSINFWELGKYATVFNLLNKLGAGDIIVLFYKGERYNYEVIDNIIVPGWNTLPFERQTTYPILTLQTCDPPGTTINRRIVTAKQVE